MHLKRYSFLALAPVPLAGCVSHSPAVHETRKGDEIVVAGQFFHTGTPVVLWMDAGGYDAYRVERRFAPYDQADYNSSIQHLSAGGGHTPNRYDIRDRNLSSNDLERVRGGDWALPTLQSNVDQFVIHFDVGGLSRNCFKTLQDDRDLSVHMMLDADGTIYQTLDLKERARHATISNNRSVGLEIANMGTSSRSTLAHWYKTDVDGRTIITFPESAGPNPVRTTNFVGRPARREIVTGPVHGSQMSAYDYTPEQYRALAKLIATLCTVFPQINCDYPRNKDGTLVTSALSREQFNAYKGVLGHYHVQTNKSDPGPALQWDYIIGEARRLMGLPPQLTVDGKKVSRRPNLIVDN